MLYYRTPGPWGPGVDANLTANQVDQNFYDVDQRLHTAITTPLAPTQITSFNAVGNQLFIHMSDGTVMGPVTLPEVRWFFRGVWQPNTVYAIDDVFTGPNNLVYIVDYPHTSGTSFDPGANDGKGNNFYEVLLAPPASVLPNGGDTGYVLTKNSANDYDAIWGPPTGPPGGAQGQVLTKFSDAPGDAGWNYQSLSQLYDVLISGVYGLNDGDYLRWSTDAARWINQPRAIYNVARETSWYPVVGDEGTFMVLENGTTNTIITIPNDVYQNFTIGSELHIHQDGTGDVTILGDSGVTVLVHASFSTKLLGQYATATVKKTAANEWRLFGLLAGA